MSNWSPAIYWIIYCTVALFFVAKSAALCLRDDDKDSSPFGFLLLIALVAIVGRWQSILNPEEMNPDEGLMLAQAMKFATDLVPWRSIDTGTGGPINSYVLLLLHWLGLPFSYLLARIAALLCIISYLSFLFLALRRIAGVRVAAFCITPLVIFHANPAYFDFVHYSSELASMTEIGLMCWIASGFNPESDRVQLIRSIFIGIVGLLIAFSKLQAIPIAAAIALVFIIVRSVNLRQTIIRAAIGGLTASVLASLIVLALIHAGVGEDLHVSFIDLPRTYTAAPLGFVETMKFLVITDQTKEFTIVAIGLISVAAIISTPGGSLRSVTGTLCLVALIAMGTYISLSQPGRPYRHYLNYYTLGSTLVLFLVARPKQFRSYSPRPS